MKTDSEIDGTLKVSEEENRKWRRLYLVVVGVLCAQIAFFVWLTKSFD